MKNIVKQTFLKVRFLAKPKRINSLWSFGLTKSFVCLLALLGGASLTGCGSDETYSEYERTQASFAASLGGDISTLQWWKTAVELKVRVTADAPVKLWVLSAEKEGTLYGYAAFEQSGEAVFTVPQTGDRTVYIVADYNRELHTSTVLLSGKLSEEVSLYYTSDSSADAFSAAGPLAAGLPAARATDRSSLFGASISGNAYHFQLSPEHMADFRYMMGKMVQEGSNARDVLGLNCNYELESNGPFEITMLAGNCLSSTSHILGYYYHTAGTYDDIKYVDLTETEIYDYIDNLAKVQYQVDATAAARDGLEVGQWYDANFDMYDLYDRTSPTVARRGDNAYNAMAVIQRYSGGANGNVTTVRGATFTVDVPKGMHVGFYDRWEVFPAPEQYDRLVAQGVKPYTSRANFKGTSFSAEDLNLINPDGNFRSFIENRPYTMWMGMENDCRGNDLDCNDVMFCVTTKMDIYKPTIVEPDFRDKVSFNDRLTWTLAFEDVARGADFDFNDAVIRFQPDYEQETCRVWVMAAGCTQRMYLHYNGPSGDVNLGEIHQLLGGTPEKTINTANTLAGVAFAEVANVAWPKEYNMNNDAQRFYIEVQRGDCTDCSDVITLADKPGVMPEALLVAGDWHWPMEGTHIFSAYRVFPLWAKDCTKLNYWNWYTSSQYGKVVTY